MGASMSLYKFHVANKLWSLVAEKTCVSHTPPFSLLSWNIDFSRPLVLTRFQSALALLEKRLSPHFVSSPPPTILLLQEFHISCFQPLLSNEFIREFYQLTNISSTQSYSTVTLVPSTLAPLVSSLARVPFAETHMSRDCLYVDLDVPLPQPSGEAEKPFLRLRIANTHLESLRGFGDTARPAQLRQVLDLLKADDIDGGLVAGDMNAISPADGSLPQLLGLTDAWLLGRADSEAAEGHTWGYQPRGRFKPDRLDKILTVGKIGCIEIERIGVGAKVEDRDVWISDHYGLSGKIVVG